MKENANITEQNTLKTQKEQADKRLLNLEIVLWGVTVVSFIIILCLCVYAINVLNIVVVPTIIIVVDFIMLVISAIYCIYIEQKAGYYQCGKCQHKYEPTFNQSMWSPHFCRTKYMKCPHCGKWSWNKKVLK